MKYTIDDLRGKYVKVGTPDTEVFLEACDTLGIRWSSGELARNKHQDKECISFNHSDNLTFATLCYYQGIEGLCLFVPKTDTTMGSPISQRTVESSAVETLKSLGYIWNGGEQWKPPVGKAPSYITDDVDDTVTARGERYGLFADGAVIMQDLKAVMRATPGWERLTPSQREALEMIQHKIGRVLNGDPTYDDNWRDIAGYATIILNELNGVKR